MTKPTDDPSVPVLELSLSSGRTIKLDAVGPMHGTLAITVDDTAKTGRSFRFKLHHNIVRDLAEGLAAYERLRLETRGEFARASEEHAARVEEARRRKGPPVFGAVAAEPTPTIDPRDIIAHRPGVPKGRVAP